MAVYEGLGEPSETAALASDLCTFVRELPTVEPGLGTFIAVFERPRFISEREFEDCLWALLSGLHVADCARYDPSASSDPENVNFGFSFSGTALFVVGMYPGSSRLSRRFEFPALVFNPRAQFDDLRRRGHYDRFAEVIRRRELILQGSLNPNLDPRKERSEARQYSGRATEEDWKCPFRT
jgi:hypothetical protein